MERLTRRVKNGIAIYNTPSGDPVKWEHNRHKVLQKLAEYEDTGLTPEEILDGKLLTGWILCSEQLPADPVPDVFYGLSEMDTYPEYIVMISGAQEPTFLKYIGNGEWYRDGNYYKVTAWMPLPEPYQEEITFSGSEKKMNGKYTWTEIGAGTGIDDIWRHDVFSSVAECIKDAVSCGIKPGEKIAVG